MPGEKYDHQSIERKWQKRWNDERVFAAPATPGKRGSYVLDMFPYPSGDGLHVGHPEGYTATDIISRYQRMQGETVMHPMGWDAFGLPAENAALKKGVHPSKLVADNIANFKRQVQSIGFSYDWDREVNTTDPTYYRWTQWIFLQLFKAGLAYEKEAPIWWCPKDKTGLANEEVIDGKCDRCGTVVEKKMLKQWMLKITAYAERLLDGLEKLDWPESIKSLQRNWIGRSEGAEVQFMIDENPVWVYTTRPDTLFGATYLVLAPEHDLVKNITTADQKKAVDDYLKKVASKSERERLSEGEKEKTGVFTGAYAVNPVNNEKIPVWIADYVLKSYGTGAIMAVPAHDERDFVFAKKFNLRIIHVIEPPREINADLDFAVPPPFAHGILPGESVIDVQLRSLDRKIEMLQAGDACYVGEGILKNSREFGGEKNTEAKSAIITWLQNKNKAKPKVNFKLRDWVFSRQRYWGEPIPVVHCPNCKQTVESTPHQHELSSMQEWQEWLEQPQSIRNADMAKAVSKDTKHKNHYVKVTFGSNVGYWRVRDIKKDVITLKHVLPGIILVPEKDLPLELPQVDKYEPTGTGESPLANIDEWVNVKCRVCGHDAKRETNTMPQWAGSCWYYIRFTDPENSKEFASAKAMKAWLPVDLYVGGAEHAVLHLLYARFWHKVLFDAGFIPKEVGDEPFQKLKNQGLILGPDGEKMSKSRGNVINPDEIIEQYGADTLRLYEMFMGPFEDAKPWDTNGIIGVRRFLEKVWRASQRVDSSKADDRWHKYAKQMTEGVEAFRFNTCVSDLMKWVNAWGTEPVSQEEFGAFLKLLSPFAPHLAEELWQGLGNKTLLSNEKWPKFDPMKIVEETVTIAVQVMGKLRATLSLPAGSDQAAVETAAKGEPNVTKFLTGEPKKVIFVKDKLINFVI